MCFTGLLFQIIIQRNMNLESSLYIILEKEKNHRPYYNVITES
jgi:hypothetical protein